MQKRSVVMGCEQDPIGARVAQLERQVRLLKGIAVVQQQWRRR